MKAASAAAALLAAGSALACGDSPFSPEEFALSTWELVSVNGQSVPGDFSLNTGGVLETVHIEYDRFQFGEVTLGQGPCINEFSWTIRGEVIEAAADGDFVLSADFKAIDIDLADFDYAVGTINGSSEMTLTFLGVQGLYRRQ